MSIPTIRTIRAISLILLAAGGLFLCSPSHLSAQAALPDEYTRQARLSETPSAGFAGGGISLSGDTAIVFSAVGCYVFVRSAGAWTQQALLVPSDGPGVFSGLVPPISVALAGDTAVVGGPGAAINGHAYQGA